MLRSGKTVKSECEISWQPSMSRLFRFPCAGGDERGPGSLRVLRGRLQTPQMLSWGWPPLAPRPQQAPCFPALLLGLSQAWGHRGAEQCPAGSHSDTLFQQLQAAPCSCRVASRDLTNSGGSRERSLVPEDDRGKKIICLHPKSGPCRQILRQVSNHLPSEMPSRL